MKTLQKLMLSTVLATGGLWVLAPATLSLTSCGAASTSDGGTGGGTGGGSGGGGGTADAGADCYAGTPTTNAQFLNACVPDSVEKVLKETPWRDGGTLPSLP